MVQFNWLAYCTKGTWYSGTVIGSSTSAIIGGGIVRTTTNVSDEILTRCANDTVYCTPAERYRWMNIAYHKIIKKLGYYQSNFYYGITENYQDNFLLPTNFGQALNVQWNAGEKLNYISREEINNYIYDDAKYDTSKEPMYYNVEREVINNEVRMVFRHFPIPTSTSGYAGTKVSLTNGSPFVYAATTACLFDSNSGLVAGSFFYCNDGTDIWYQIAQVRGTSTLLLCCNYAGGSTSTSFTTAHNGYTILYQHQLADDLLSTSSMNLQIPLSIADVLSAYGAYNYWNKKKDTVRAQEQYRQIPEWFWQISDRDFQEIQDDRNYYIKDSTQFDSGSDYGVL